VASGYPQKHTIGLAIQNKNKTRKIMTTKKCVSSSDNFSQICSKRDYVNSEYMQTFSIKCIQLHLSQYWIKHNYRVVQKNCTKLMAS